MRFHRFLLLACFFQVPILVCGQQIAHPDPTDRSEQASELKRLLQSSKVAEIRRGIDSLNSLPAPSEDVFEIVRRRRYHPEFRRIYAKLSQDRPKNPDHTLNDRKPRASRTGTINPATMDRLRINPKPVGWQTTGPQRNARSDEEPTIEEVQALMSRYGSHTMETMRINDQLREWGPSAAPAVPKLIEQLDLYLRQNGGNRSQHARSLMTVLGSIGPAARDAVPAIFRYLDQVDEDKHYLVYGALNRIRPLDKLSIERILEFGKSSPKVGIQFSATRLAHDLMSEANPSSQSRRFEDRGRYVLDKRTGLLWQKDGQESGRKNFFEGQEYAENLTLGGISGWRLPTASELGSIHPAIDAPFKNTAYVDQDGPTRRWYWSSHLPSENYAFLAQWDGEGGMNNGYADRNDAYIRCVHDSTED